MLYWLVAAVPAVAAVVAHASLVDRRRAILIDTIRDLGVEFLNGLAWHSRSVQHAMVAILLLLCLTWPWVTLVALLVFQQSMAQARINRVHVLRCVVYSADVILWLGLAMLPALLLADGRGRGGSYDEPTAWFYLTAAATLGWMSWRLTIAYRHYLRFDRPVATVIAAQCIVVIALLTVAMWAGFSG